MAIQDEISAFFDMLGKGASFVGEAGDRATRSGEEGAQLYADIMYGRPVDGLTERDRRRVMRDFGMLGSRPDMTLEEEMMQDPSIGSRIIEIVNSYRDTYPEVTAGPEIDYNQRPDTSRAMPRPRPAAPAVPVTTIAPPVVPTESLSDAEMMQFESVPYARANEIQTMIDQVAALQGGENRGGVSTAGLADDEMIANFNPAQRAAYARMVRDMVGTTGSANMPPEGAERRDALTNSAIQAVIDRERGADRGRVGSQATAEDERRALEFGAFASTGAGNALKGGIKGAQAVQRAGGLRALLNRIGLGNLAKARQATAQTQYPIGVATRFGAKPQVQPGYPIGVGTRFGAARPQMMRDPATGRMLSARDIGPQPLPYGPQPLGTVRTPAQIRTQLMLDAARRAPGGYADGGRIQDGIMGVYDRM